MNPLAIRALVLLAGAAVAFGAGWSANGWRLNTKIADMKTQRAINVAAQSQAALKDLADASKKINEAATEYSNVETTLGKKMDQLSKEIKNAKPLPRDCRPDDIRVRNLDAAIDAANEAASRRKAR